MLEFKTFLVELKNEIGFKYDVSIFIIKFKELLTFVMLFSIIGIVKVSFIVTLEVSLLITE